MNVSYSLRTCWLLLPSVVMVDRKLRATAGVDLWLSDESCRARACSHDFLTPCERTRSTWAKVFLLIVQVVDMFMSPESNWC
jgi:hypothetical protein